MASSQMQSILAPYNYDGQSRLARYEYSVSHDMNDQQQQQRPKLMSNDRFKFDINVLSCSFELNTVSFVNLTTLLHNSSQEIPCKSFFLPEGQDFLRFHLSHPYIPSESLDLIIPRIVSQVQQLFDLIDQIDLAPSSNSEYVPSVFSLTLDIIVEPGTERAVREDVITRMIPASTEAIYSLKECKVMKPKDNCSICMEEFGDDVDGVTVSAMPCNHLFHQQCIVQWLQTNHVCPLCRYSMPTYQKETTYNI
ncbi:Zinc finger, RING-type [Sesbania bispinosa]|nr:Zinc finger, RING-type [Sesbania bispinosa]